MVRRPEQSLSKFNTSPETSLNADCATNNLDFTIIDNAVMKLGF